MAELKIGQLAPRFSLKDKDGKPHKLGASNAEYTVLYFYPKDDTPGCTIEAKEFSDAMKQFKARNVQVYGISGGSEKTKASFCKKHGLSVPLVSDSDFKVAKSYGAYGMKKFMGRSFQGIFRKTFLVDKNGKIARVFATVKPEGHADEVLEAIDALKKGAVKSSVKAAKKPATKKSAASKKVTGRKKATAKPLAKKASSPRKALSGRKVAKKVAAKPAKRAVAKKAAKKK